MSEDARRVPALHRGLQLEWLTIGWCALEAGGSLFAGVRARSVALVGFGADSVIEMLAALVVLRRLRAEVRRASQREIERQEHQALRLVGLSFLLIGAYVAYDAARTLWEHHAPERSVIGVVIAACALIVMPALAVWKLRIGHALESGALVADAKETFACAWLSGTLLVGIGFNLILGWWWADPVAALVMVPLLIREGREALGEVREGKEGSDLDVE
jgi:divalent metal cation (Fe/Co/Zn/Cd) transporter